MTNMDALKLLSEKIRSVNEFVRGTADSLINVQNALIEANKAFMALLESEERGGWIPVTDQLPKDDEVVLVTRLYIEGRKRNLKRFVDAGSVCGGHWSFVADEYALHRDRLTDPIAWMPLPKPYRGILKEKTE